MEPVNFPRSITAVSRPVRVKRVRSREDRRQEGAFQQQLRRQAPGLAPPEEPEADTLSDPGAETPGEAAPRAPEENAPRQISIRV